MEAHQATPSLGFSRQEHWSGFPFPSPMHESEKWKWSRSVVSDSSRPHGLQPTRLHPWDFLGKSTGVGCHCLLRWLSILKNRDITLPTKVHLVRAMVFPVVMYEMWELDYNDSWAPKNWCFWRPLRVCKEIKPVNPKGNQSWISIGRRTDAETEAPILWPPDAKNWIIGKDPDPGKDWRQEEKGTTEDEMVG